MASNKTITINGRQYDALTGLPVATPAPTEKKAPAPAKKVAAAAKPAARPAAPAKKAAPSTARNTQTATTVHSSAPKRSQTLRRQAVKKPVAPTKVVRRPKPAGVRHMDIARSTQVARFAPHPEAAAKAATTAKATPAKSVDAPAITHPIARKAVKKPTKAKAPAVKPLTAKQVKDAEIKKAIASKPVAQTKKQRKATKKKSSTPWKKRTIILTIAAVFCLLAVVAATHVFPGLSVQVASIRSGVSAAYPKYIPDGYSLSQPIKYNDGRIAITFKSNSNDTHYVLVQSNSTWDSTAVLDNLVKKEAANNYVTTRERGLTIYTYQTHAAWVNGGILYTIEGDADLSGDQIRKIATSL